MNVLGVLLTGGEVHFEDSFIAGYESNGGTWSGTFTLQQNVSAGAFMGVMASAVGTYDMVVNNYGISGDIMAVGANLTLLQSYYDAGCMLVSPAGSNFYHTQSYFKSQLYSPVICGAGATENMTGGDCEFFDIDPYAEVLTISALTQSSATTIITCSGSNSSAYTDTIILSGVTGFANNPNGIFQYERQFDTTLLIDHILGAGTYGGGAIGNLHFQSYATPYIAGKIAYLIDTVYGGECTARNYDLARKLLRETTDYRNIDLSGFGRINLTNAIAQSDTAIPDLTPGTLTAERTSTTNIRLSFGIINEADRYEIYRNADLIATIDVSTGIKQYDYTISGKALKSNPYRFAYRGVTDDYEGDTSNSVYVPYTKGRYILTAA